MKNPARLQTLAMPLALIGICIFFALRESAFIGPRNLTQLLVEFSITGTLALGMFMILLTGQIDLSVGSGVGLIGGLAAVLATQQAWPAPLALVAGTLVAVILWALMGALIVRHRIPAFIITLGGLLVFKGLFWLVIQNSTVPVTRGDQDNLYSLLTTYYLPAPAGLVLAAGVLGVLGLAGWRSRSARITHGLPVAAPGTLALRRIAAAGGTLPDAALRARIARAVAALA